MISRELIRNARGTVVAVDGGALLEYFAASKALRQAITADFDKFTNQAELSIALERWEIAHSTLGGAVVD